MDSDSSSGEVSSTTDQSSSDREYVKKKKKCHKCQRKRSGHSSKGRLEYTLERKFQLKNGKSKSCVRSRELQYMTRGKSVANTVQMICFQMPSSNCFGFLQQLFPQFSSSQPCIQEPERLMIQAKESSSSKDRSARFSPKPGPSGYKTSKRKKASAKKYKKQSSRSKRRKRSSTSSDYSSESEEESSSNSEKYRKKSRKHRHSTPLLRRSTPVARSADKKNSESFFKRPSSGERKISNSFQFDERRSGSDNRRASMPSFDSRRRSSGFDNFNETTTTPKWSNHCDRVNKPFRMNYGNRGRGRGRTRSFEPWKRNEKTDFRSESSFSRKTNSQFPNQDQQNLQSFQSEVGFIDTHCHLDMLFDRVGFEGTHSEYKKDKGDYPLSYKGCITVFIHPKTFKKRSMWRTLLDDDQVWGAFGCHPHHADLYDDEVEEDLLNALEFDQVVALGEIGMDFSKKNNNDISQQEVAFSRQLQLLKKLDRKLPVIIHCREAHNECFKIMKEEVDLDHPIHLHCFTDGWSMAQEWLNTFPNLYIGVTNLVGNQNAFDVREIVKYIPLSRLVIETDAPYFVPSELGHSETSSNPGMAIYVAQEISKIKQQSLENILKILMENTKALYDI